MKKRIFKIFKIVVCLFLFLIITLPICVLGYVYLAVGGMADKEAALQTAENHLRDNYADMDYEITEITYDWRMGSFYASVYSPSNIDGAFVIRLSGRGKLIEDTYDSMVEGRYNITHRLMYEYGDKVDAVFESEDFPYTVSIGYGALEFGGNFVKDRNDGVILESDLINNTRYDVCELGATNGMLVLYVKNDTVTDKKAAEILLKTKELFDRAGIPFYSITFCLEYPDYVYEGPVQPLTPKGEIYLKNFLSSDIYEEGLVQRVRAADTEKK